MDDSEIMRLQKMADELWLVGASSVEVDGVFADALRHGTGVMLGGKRIDPADFWNPPPLDPNFEG